MHCKYVPYKALKKFSKALYGTKGVTYSARVFRPVMYAKFITMTVKKDRVPVLVGEL